jgi:hypothetical protein
MTPYEQKKLDMEFRSYLSENFDKPSDCRDLDQLRLYINALCNKIEEYSMRYNYVPGTAYWHLTEYNSRQNQLVDLVVKGNR